MDVPRILFGPGRRVTELVGLPWWMQVGAHAAAFVIGISAAVAVIISDASASLRIAQTAFVCVALVPWWPSLRLKSASVLFVGLTVAPVALLALTGAPPIGLGLIALSTARVAVFAGVWTSAAYACAAVGVVVGHWLALPHMNLFVWKSYVELGLALGWALRSQRALVLRTEEAVHERSRLSALEERRRIAREVHDVIAHSLSVTLLQLNSARLLLQDDPDGAAEVLDEAAQHGRASLEEVRHVVGLLSEPSSIEVPADATSAAQAVEDLVASYRRAGLDVDLRLDVEMLHMGLLALAPTRLWGSAYRIIQEALANCVKHAPGVAAVVSVLLTDTDLNIEVLNPLPVPAPEADGRRSGYGLQGMRERAEMTGGTLVSGPDGERWAVRCALPLNPNSSSDHVRSIAVGRAS